MATDISQAAAAQGDLPRALAFVRDAFAQWHKQGMIRAEEHATLDAYYQDLQRSAESGAAPAEPVALPPPDVCWSCKDAVGPDHYCAACGAPARTEAVDRLRHLVCLCHEIRKHERAGRLDLSAAHGCMYESNSRIAALRRKLDGQRVPAALPADAVTAVVAPRPAAPPAEPAPAPASPRRNVLEILLDPRSIQWLLALGGAALVIGLIIWLAASGLFENKLFVAVLLGAANAALLAGGWALIRLTRYQLAGRAVTLLACLVMPLNLWFYDYQGLITIKDGGHLWVAALVCCVLYAASAALLRDPMLVYVFVGGVALAGLLVLADHTVGLFWEASAPAGFLTVLGLTCIHLVRAFPEGDGPFTRRRFGLAFFWSGHAALAAGLLVVLVAQLTCGVFYDAFFRPFYAELDRLLDYTIVTGQSEIVATMPGRLLALAIVAAAAYAYAYSDLVVRRVGVYIHLAVVCFLWAEVLLLNLAFAAWPELKDHGWEIIIMALALTGLLAKVLLTMFVPPGWGLRRTAPALALILSLVPLAIGTWLHVQAVVWPPDAAWRVPLTWWFVAAMLVSAVACRASAYLHQGGLTRFITPSVGHQPPERPEPQPSAGDRWLMTIYLFAGGGSLLLVASGVVMAYDPALSSEWVWVAPILMLIPLGYLTASRLYRGRSLETPVVWAAHAMTLVLVFTCLGTAFEGAFTPLHGHPYNLALSWFFAEAALFYLLAAVWRDREFAVYACAASAAAALWQLLTAYDQPSEYYVGAFAALGLALLVVYRFVALEKKPAAGLGRAAFQSGNALTSLAAAAGALRALTFLPAAADLLPGQEADQIGRVVVLEILLAGAGLAALFLARHPGWRRWYLATAVGNAALAVLVVVLRIQWSWQEKLELTCLVLGAAVLLLAHVGWFREREREDDTVTFGLLLGSLLVAVPLTWAVLYCRFSGEPFDTFHTLNEIGMLGAGLLLLGGGGVTRIKSTTVTGAAMLAVYLLTLVAFIQFRDRMWMIGVYLTIGGAVFFGVGLLLAVYRDRLLALPQKVKRHEGVFRILNWR